MAGAGGNSSKCLPGRGACRAKRAGGGGWGGKGPGVHCVLLQGGGCGYAVALHVYSLETFFFTWISVFNPDSTRVKQAAIVRAERTEAT